MLREGAWQTLTGLLSGFAVIVSVATLLRALLLGVTPADLLTYAGVFTLLASVSFVACYLPARTASRTDPADALRDE